MRTAPNAPLAMISRAQDRRVEAVAVTDDQPDIGALGCSYHAAAFVERDRHRFFDQHVLAASRSRFDVLGVQLVRRGDIDDVDFRVRAQGLDRRIDPAPDFLGEARSCFGARIGGGDQLDPPVRGQGWQHQRKCAAQSCDADAQPPLRHEGSTGGAVRPRPAGLLQCATSRLRLLLFT
jgi:hypothetical protein